MIYPGSRRRGGAVYARTKRQQEGVVRTAGCAVVCVSQQHRRASGACKRHCDVVPAAGYSNGTCSTGRLRPTAGLCPVIRNTSQLQRNSMSHLLLPSRMDRSERRLWITEVNRNRHSDGGVASSSSHRRLGEADPCYTVGIVPTTIRRELNEDSRPPLAPE